MIRYYLSRVARHKTFRCVALLTIASFFVSSLVAQQGNRLAYLDEYLDPYYVNAEFPKLTTPQWVGEPGVQAVVVLAIDDMRDTRAYENYLRPILQRLKKIDGRAPVSIMTCSVNVEDPLLQVWLDEGLSIDVHTVDHPCPLLHGGDLAKAKSTVDRCIDLLHEIPGNHPVAFRMPCCDSQNTPSPRFWTEIFNRATEDQHYLTIDSSVFQIFTPADPSLPRNIVLNDKGEERFRRYVPFPSYVNTIENYPYPYLIGRKCWQFPCMVPSDWQAQHVQGNNHPDTVSDWKLAIDATVIKQGVFCLVFHPHGWVRSDQVMEFVDYADKTYGNRVKFLTFRECYERLKQNVQDDQDMGRNGSATGFRLLDVNNDGYMDIVNAVRSNETNQRRYKSRTRIWDQNNLDWVTIDFPLPLMVQQGSETTDVGAKFGVLGSDGFASVIVHHRPDGQSPTAPLSRVFHFDGQSWTNDAQQWNSLSDQGVSFIPPDCQGVRFRDLDNNGICELIIASNANDATARSPTGNVKGIYQLNLEQNRWNKLPFTLPKSVSLELPAQSSTSDPADAGLRFVDVNRDGMDDIIFSDHHRFSLHLFESMKSGWSVEVVNGQREDNTPQIPMIIRADGSNNGSWFHSKHLWIQNENTDQLPDKVRRLSFADMLKRFAVPADRK